MKKIVKSIALLMAAAFSLSACQKEMEKPSTEGVTIIVNATSPQTKTVFGEKVGNSYPTIWTDEQFVAFSLDGAALEGSIPVPTSDGTGASLPVSFSTNPKASGSVYGFSPMGYYDFNETNYMAGFSAVSSSDTYAYFVLPPFQTPLANSCEEGVQLLVGETEYTGSLPSEIDMHFTHLTAYAKMTVTGFEGGDIEAISITFPTPVAGFGTKYYYKANANHAKGEVTGADKNTITLDVKNVTNNVFWFGLLPTGTLSSGKLIVMANGSDGATYTKQITLSPSKSIAFNAGRVSAFNVDMEDAEVIEASDEWTLVENVSELTAGDQLVIASNENGVTATDVSSQIMGRVTSRFSSDKKIIEELGEGTVVLTLGGTSGAWTLSNGTKLLGATSEKKLAWGSGITTWTISIGTNSATIQNKTTGYGRFLYNVGAPRFTTYTSATSNTMMLPQLYRKAATSGGGTPTTPPDASNTEVVTGGAGSLTTSTVTLYGNYSGAVTAPREAGFEWGLTQDFGNEAMAQTSLTTTSGTFNARLTGLTAGATYYYRAYIIVNEGGIFNYHYGSVASFTVPEDTTTPSSNGGWYELPYMNPVKSGSYLMNGDRSNEWYAYHMCTGGEKGPGGKTARNYTVCYSGKHHCTMWVAAPRHAMYDGGSGRNDSYRRDGAIPADIQYSSKSTGGGCNKGHMLGSAERTSSVATNKDVFYYPNIAPQLSSGFNTGGGGWNLLEDWVDGQVCADTLYEVVGCHFEAFKDGYGYTVTPKTISFGGRNDVTMPTMFYYILLRTKSGNSEKALKDCSASELKCAAFVRAHTNSLKGQKPTRQEMMSVADLEKITGYTYFVNVPNAPKDTFSPSDWGL
ncbi:MAG: DNA/RNA non-specific endonuclease [Bacteroidales bacterium]|nr:DNA/RNA non-specific endonuclease [Bacteroidales bacterium]